MTPADEKDMVSVKRWISVETVLSIAATLVIVGMSWSAQQRDLAALTQQVTELKRTVEGLQQRDITPGAAQRIAVLEAQEESLREELREQRLEILGAVRSSLTRSTTRSACGCSCSR